MNNPFSALPSYIKESPKFSKFLELVSGYLVSGAMSVSLFKESFLATEKSRFVIQALAKQLGVEVTLPFTNGQPNWNAYYRSLYFAYRAKAFNSAFTGTLVELLLGDNLKDVSNMAVVDFSVAKGVDKSPMSVLYSVVSFDDDLTTEIVQEFLIPRVTGINTGVYFLKSNQEVFGYDLDEVEEKKIGPDHVTEVPITEGLFSISSVTIRSLGTGYQVNDVVTVADLGIQLRITDLSVGAFLSVVNPSQRFTEDPTRSEATVTGGSGKNMTVNIVGGASRGYFIRGWDQGSFLSMTRR